MFHRAAFILLPTFRIGHRGSVNRVWWFHLLVLSFFNVCAVEQPGKQSHSLLSDATEAFGARPMGLRGDGIRTMGDGFARWAMEFARWAMEFATHDGRRNSQRKFDHQSQLTFEKCNCDVGPEVAAPSALSIASNAVSPYMVYTAAGDHHNVNAWLSCGSPVFKMLVSF